MAPREHTAVEGIVLRAYASGEADLVMRVLTPTEGKISVIAKHGKRGGKRFGSALDLFDCGRFEIRPSRGSLPTLQGFAPISSFARLRDSLDKIASGALICEIADYLMIEGSESEESAQYAVVIQGLDSIQHAATRAEILAATFTAAASLIEQAGFLDREQLGDGSVKRLERLLLHIERSVEKRLVTRAAFELTIEAFKRENAEQRCRP